MHDVLRFAVASYGDSEVQVFSEPGDRAGGDGQAANERPACIHRVQVGDCPAEC